MPKLLVRNLEDETIERLKVRARINNRSLQAEVQLILEQATKIQPNHFWQDAEQMRSRLTATDKIFSDSAELLREDRNR